MFFLDERFLAFIPILVCAYWLAGRALRDWVLLAGNAAWLALFSPSTLFALVLATCAIVYPASQLAEPRAGRTRAQTRAAAWWGICALIVGISWIRLGQHLGPLDPASSTAGEWFLQCIGISYFLLKAIHVLVATSSGIVPAPSLIELLHYVLFLPTLTSGPIYRLDTFNAQRAAPRKLTWDHVHEGLLRIALGMGKKVVVVPYLTKIVVALHARGSIWEPPAFVVLYVMLFIDFSGYSDIAIGTGRLLGFDVPENFKKPFTSTTLTQFWRNWHATLGDWVRENLFIPLGGVRARGVRLSAIVVGCMVIVGLWHSYSATFLLWGAYHGTLLLVENWLGVKPLRPHQTPRWRLWLRYAVIQALVIGGMFAFIRGL
jgi:D-alanyl-lipoteichoic acid acyltransferase DltB (MBOAT superfamily)